MKYASLALAIVGLMIRGYFMYQANQLQAARQTLASRQTMDQMRRNMSGPDADADAAAFGKGDGRSKPSAMLVSNNPADAAQRQEIEASLKAMHLTTLMPGQPGIVIIDKQEYSEGEELPLGKGRKAKIVAVQNDGVRLTCNGMAFHLDAPAGPDLAAMRKKR